MLEITASALNAGLLIVRGALITSLRSLMGEILFLWRISKPSVFPVITPKRRNLDAIGEAAMSKSLENQVWHSALDAELKPVAAVMADMGNDDGYGIYPSVAYIAWLLSRSERSIQTALKKLVQLGILDRVANAKGGRGLKPRYQLNADALPERPKWRSERKGAESAPFTVAPKGCNEQQERVQSTSQKGENPAPDPLVDPLEIRKTPLPPKPKRSHKPPEPTVVLDPPYHGDLFVRALEKYRQVRQEMGSPLTPTMTEELYAKLAHYPEDICTTALRDATAGGYKGVYPERHGFDEDEKQPAPRRQTIAERLNVTEEEAWRIAAGTGYQRVRGN